MTVDPKASPADVARELFEGARLQGAALDAALDNACSPDYWRAVVPGLGVGAADVSVAVDPIEASIHDAVVRRFKDEGYLKLASVVQADAVAAMHAAVSAVERAGWPPVFAWLFDEFWLVSRSSSLVELFSALLGTGYRQTPYVWTHIVSAGRGATGWAPHVDNRGDTFRLTVWIALSDATVDSGCMTVVPRNRAPRSTGAHWFDQPALPMRDALALLQASRPLPVPAGSILAWDAGVMHWGSAREEDGKPRVSISMEFVGSADPSVLADTIAADANRLPSFDERLRVVANAVATYHASDRRAARHVTLAERLLDRLGR